VLRGLARGRSGGPIGPTTAAAELTTDPLAYASYDTNEPPAEAVHNPQSAMAVAPEPADLVSQLERLARLRDTGALTEDEFQTAKAKLLQSEA
jgi:hypothetical protein